MNAPLTEDPSVPYFDTSSQAWFLPRFPMIDFSTERDAKHAYRLGCEIAQRAEQDLADKVREVLP